MERSYKGQYGQLIIASWYVRVILAPPYAPIAQLDQSNRLLSDRPQIQVLLGVPKEDGGRKFIVLFLLAKITNFKIGSIFDFNSKGGY